MGVHHGLVVLADDPAAAAAAVAVRAFAASLRVLATVAVSGASSTWGRREIENSFFAQKNEEKKKSGARGRVWEV